MKKAPQPPFLPYALEAKNINARREAVNLAQEIGQELRNPSSMPKANTLGKFNILARLIRIMDAKDIHEGGQELYAPEKSGDFHSSKFAATNGAWKAYRDAVAQAGTPSAFTVIRQWIEDKKVRNEEAAEIIATLVKTIRYPTEQLMKEFFELATSKQVQSQQYLNSTALHAMTSFLSYAQVNNHSAYSYYPTHAYGRLADAKYRIVQRVVIPYLSHQLNLASQKEDSVKMLTYIRAVGNLGHPEILNVFEPYLEGRMPATEFQRLAIVVAMSKLSQNYPKLARTVLYKIYQNAGERHEIRAAAVFAIMRTNPPAAMLQRMAGMTHIEQSQHVASAVKSALESASELENPHNQQLAHAARAARKQLNPKIRSIQYSRTYLRDMVMDELNLAYSMQASYIGSDDSIVPKAAFLRTTKNMGGYKNRYNEYYAMISSVDQLINMVGDQFKASPSLKTQANNEYHPNHRNQPRNKMDAAHSQISFEKIDQLLNIQAEQQEELEGQILMKILNTKRLFTFNNETIENFPQYFRNAAKNLRGGQQFNFTKFYNQEVLTIAFPLASGLPFVFTYKTPTVVQFGGEIRARTTPDLAEGHLDHVRVPKAINASAEIDALYATMTDAKIGFLTPFDHQRYIAGVQKKTQVYLPLRMTMDIDLVNGDVEAKFAPLDAKNDFTLVHASQWPYTSRMAIKSMPSNSQNDDTKLINVADAKTFDQRYGQQSTGLVIRVEAKYEKEFIDAARVMNYLRRNDYVSLIMYTQAMESNEHYNINLSADNQRSTAKTVKVNLNFQTRQSWEQNGKDKPIQPEWRHSDAKHNNNNYAQPKTSAANSQSRREQFLQNAGAGIPNSQVNLVDAAISFEGKERCAEYVATIAMADSKANNQQRYLAFFNANPMKSGDQAQACIHFDLQQPDVPTLNFKNALAQNGNGQWNLEAEFGDKCQGGQHVTLKGKMEQSNDRRNYLAEQPLAKVCKHQMEQGNYQLPACQNVTNRASVYDRYSINADFENLSTQTKINAQRAYALARHYGFSYVQEDVVKYQGPGPHKASINIRFAPNLRSANVTLEAPTHGAKWTNLRVPAAAKYALAAHPAFNIVDRLGAYATKYNYNRKFINYH